MSAEQSSVGELKVDYRPIGQLIPYAGNARTHSKKQIAQIATSIRKFGFNTPVIVDAQGSILAGHGRVAAAKTLEMTRLPVVEIGHLTEAQLKAYRLADNRLAEQSGWSKELLAIELQGLAELELDFELEITGFEGALLDELLDPNAAVVPEKADRVPEQTGPAVSRLGDVWEMGEHRLVCGDATDPAAYEMLMQGERAQMTFTDPPYNVKIDGNVGGKGKIARREFIEGSGEFSRDGFISFLTKAFKAIAAASVDGAIVYACIDWRHFYELQSAGEAAFDEFKNVCVWVKSNAGLGTFYRSQHEFIGLFKVGEAEHINNFRLGETGRWRSNVFQYPGVNAFRKGRHEDLELHPTVKPVALVVDVIRDVTRRRHIVLDPFAGSGTTMIAAQKTGRRARLIELDPLYCDTICRRWAEFAGTPAVLAASGQTFDEVMAERLREVGDE